MYSGSEIADRSWITLHQDYLHCKQQLKHYKYLYKNECVLTQSLKKRNSHLKKENKSISEKFEEIKSKYLAMRQPVEPRKGLCKIKPWCKITCEWTKRQRLSQYGNIVLNHIQKNTPQCKWAELFLCISGKQVNYSWRPTHFKGSSLGKNKNNMFFHHDHCYAAEPLSDDDDDDEIDIDYSKIFDCHGNWQVMHKRTIGHVMDTYRISHEAYHELRHAGKGHFPPLSHIRKEKEKTSAEIPYIKHSTVSRYSYVTKFLECY